MCRPGKLALKNVVSRMRAWAVHGCRCDCLNFWGRCSIVFHKICFVSVGIGFGASICQWFKALDV